MGAGGGTMTGQGRTSTGQGRTTATGCTTTGAAHTRTAGTGTQGTQGAQGWQTQELRAPAAAAAKRSVCFIPRKRTMRAYLLKNETNRTRKGCGAGFLQAHEVLQQLLQLGTAVAVGIVHALNVALLAAFLHRRRGEGADKGGDGAAVAFGKRFHGLFLCL